MSNKQNQQQNSRQQNQQQNNQQNQQQNNQQQNQQNKQCPSNQQQNQQNKQNQPPWGGRVLCFSCQLFTAGAANGSTNTRAASSVSRA